MRGSVGLIGIGLVGTALAERLAGAGVSVAGYDILPERGLALERLGGRMLTDAAAVAEACETLVLSLVDSATVSTVVRGSRGVLETANPPSIIVDTTTGNPQAGAALAADLADRGITYLDATISGSSQQVRDGQALFMVGGDRAVFDDCAPLFDAMGGYRVHLGPAGSGARAKLATNLVMGLNRLALAEGLVYATELGLDAASFVDLLLQTPAYSRQMDNKGPKMAGGDFAPQGRLAQHAKDVDLILESAAGLGLDLPASRLHQALLRAAIEAGDGDLDNSAIIRQLQRLQQEGSDGQKR